MDPFFFSRLFCEDAINYIHSTALWFRAEVKSNLHNHDGVRMCVVDTSVINMTSEDRHCLMLFIIGVWATHIVEFPGIFNVVNFGGNFENFRQLSRIFGILLYYHFDVDKLGPTIADTWIDAEIGSKQTCGAYILEMMVAIKT